VVDDHAIRVCTEELRLAGDRPGGIFRPANFEIMAMNANLLKCESLGSVLYCLEIDECIVAVTTDPHTYHRLILEDLL
jgi:hypothetical protein